MSAGWTAASTRGKLLVTRCLGVSRARQLAGSDDLAQALDDLRTTAYGHYLPPDPTMDDAHRAVDGTCLWHLRILAGWAPPKGSEPLRALAARYEISATLDHLAQISGTVPAPTQPAGNDRYQPGDLSIAWGRISTARGPEELQATLAASSWGDPGGTTCAEVEISMKARRATWLAQLVPDAPVWGVAAAALIAARIVAGGRMVADLPAGPRRDLVRLLGQRAGQAESLTDLAAAVPTDVRWVLEDVDSAADLWLSEARWWSRLESTAGRLLRGRGGAAVTTGAGARLVADAWRVNAALEAAAWGATGTEVFDAVA